MFVIYTGDYIENYPISFSGPEYTDYLVPDFNFWAWPEVGIDDYEDTCNQMLEASRQGRNMINFSGLVIQIQI